ncbi:MAG: hypothetical protein IKE74_05790 [Mogibacterium sp.]|nr:hypothetical protein [Mogibacterium sp.]
MIGKTIDTTHGTIHYWIDPAGACKEPQLVFLPGLTADHRLFDRQIECFEGRYLGQMYSQLYLIRPAKRAEIHAIWDDKWSVIR